MVRKYGDWIKKLEFSEDNQDMDTWKFQQIRAVPLKDIYAYTYSTLEEGYAKPIWNPRLCREHDSGTGFSQQVLTNLEYQ